MRSRRSGRGHINNLKSAKRLGTQVRKIEQKRLTFRRNLQQNLMRGIRYIPNAKDTGSRVPLIEDGKYLDDILYGDPKREVNKSNGESDTTWKKCEVVWKQRLFDRATTGRIGTKIVR